MYIALNTGRTSIMKESQRLVEDSSSDMFGFQTTRCETADLWKVLAMRTADWTANAFGLRLRSSSSMEGPCFFSFFFSALGPLCFSWCRLCFFRFLSILASVEHTDPATWESTTKSNPAPLTKTNPISAAKAALKILECRVFLCYQHIHNTAVVVVVFSFHVSYKFERNTKSLFLTQHTQRISINVLLASSNIFKTSLGNSCIVQSNSPTWSNK